MTNKRIMVNQRHSILQILMLSYLLIIFGSGCFYQAPPIHVNLPSTATPTPEPTPVKSADYQLTIISNILNQEEEFISTDDLVFSGTNSVGIDYNNIIEWSFMDINFQSNNTTGSPFRNTGNTYVFQAQPLSLNLPAPEEKYTGIGRNYPLNYLITAQLIINNGLDYTIFEIKQNNLAELRQEYCDFSITAPDKDCFDQIVPQGVYSNLRVLSDTGGICARHQSWIIEKLYEKAIYVYNDVDFYIGRQMRITSGYRCPAGNRRAGGATNSQHPLGKALDYAQTGDDSSFTIWEIADFLRDNNELYNIDQIIIYDQFEFIYTSISNTIPQDYSQRGTTTNPKYPYQTEVVRYTHGHVDWRNQTW